MFDCVDFCWLIVGFLLGILIGIIITLAVATTPNDKFCPECGTHYNWGEREPSIKVIREVDWNE